MEAIARGKPSIQDCDQNRNSAPALPLSNAEALCSGVITMADLASCSGKSHSCLLNSLGEGEGGTGQAEGRDGVLTVRGGRGGV